MESENAIFFDCDTLVFNNPYSLIEGNFDIKARPSTYQPPTSQWKNMFDFFNQQYIDWMPNAGVLVFKNGSHKRIQQKWKKYLSKDLMRFFPDKGTMRLKDQWSLALAISDLNVHKMTKKEHLIEWDEGIQSDATVYHYDQKSSSGVTVEMIRNRPIWFAKRLYRNKIGGPWRHNS